MRNPADERSRQGRETLHYLKTLFHDTPTRSPQAVTRANCGDYWREIERRRAAQ